MPLLSNCTEEDSGLGIACTPLLDTVFARAVNFESNPAGSIKNELVRLDAV